MIVLEPKSITDEIMALTALRSATASHGEGEPPLPLLTPDQLPGLRVIMRMVFAEIVMALADLITECDLDSSDPQPDEPYSDEAPLRLALEFGCEARLGGKMLIALRRKLEHCVAAGTLGWIASDTDPELCSRLNDDRTGALAAIRLICNDPAHPFVRRGFP